jgi:hypothetical protein
MQGSWESGGCALQGRLTLQHLAPNLKWRKWQGSDALKPESARIKRLAELRNDDVADAVE